MEEKCALRFFVFSVDPELLDQYDLPLFFLNLIFTCRSGRFLSSKGDRRGVVFPCIIFGSRNRGFDLGAVWPVLVAALGGDRARALKHCVSLS